MKFIHSNSLITSKLPAKFAAEHHFRPLALYLQFLRIAFENDVLCIWNNTYVSLVTIFVIYFLFTPLFHIFSHIFVSADFQLKVTSKLRNYFQSQKTKTWHLCLKLPNNVIKRFVLYYDKGNFLIVTNTFICWNFFYYVYNIYRTQLWNLKSIERISKVLTLFVRLFY